MDTTAVPPSLQSSPTVSAQSPWERNRRPPARRWLRRHGLRVVVAGLLVIAGAATGGMLAAAGDTRSEVLVTARPISAGQRLVAADLRTARMVVPAGVATIAASRQAQVVGRRMPVPMLAGQLLSSAVLTTPSWPGAGYAVVAVKVAAGQYPPDIAAGSMVEAVFVAGPNTATASNSK